MVEVGKVAYIRTTQEPVFVLAFMERSADNYFPTMFTVRRPVLTREGMRHLVESFYAEELMTREELSALHNGREEAHQLMDALFEGDPKAN
jgi:hypothetical protein